MKTHYMSLKAVHIVHWAVFGEAIPKGQPFADAANRARTHLTWLKREDEFFALCALAEAADNERKDDDGKYITYEELGREVKAQFEATKGEAK